MEQLQNQAIQSDSDKSSSILFVDDEKNILSAIQRLFRQTSHRVYLAESGKEGLEILTKNEIDLVISDMNMPYMDGVEFLEKVTKHWPETVRMLLTGYADLDTTINAINKGSIAKYIRKPWDDVDFVITVDNALKTKQLKEEHKLLLELTQKQNKQLQLLNNNLEDAVNKRTQELNKALDGLKSVNIKLKENYLSLVKVFASVINLRDTCSQGKNRRVADISQRISAQMGLTGDVLQNILIAGLLHGIGKMAFSDELLTMPFSEHSAQDRNDFKKYPEYGENLLSGFEPMKDVANLIRHQLERFDGHGFPDNLSGNDIPLGSRILSVVIGAEMTIEGILNSETPPMEILIETMEKEKGKKYDPDVVDQYLKVIKSQPDLVHLG